MARYRSMGFVAACCLVVTAACAQGQEQPGISATTTVTATPTGAPAATQFPPKPARDAKTVALQDFVTPSGNITCTDEFDVLSCLVDETDFPAPTESSDCEQDWVANEVDFDPPVTTLGACRGDPPSAALHPDAPTLQYGTVNTLKDGVRCLSEEQGLSCWAADSGHGFFVSRSVFAVF